MKNKMTACEISNQVYQLNIPQELYEKRDEFCPSDGSVTCSANCPIYRKYSILGLSCNQALDRYPEECILMMKS